MAKNVQQTRVEFKSAVKRIKVFKNLSFQGTLRLDPLLECERFIRGFPIKSHFAGFRSEVELFAACTSLHEAASGQPMTALSVTWMTEMASCLSYPPSRSPISAQIILHFPSTVVYPKPHVNYIILCLMFFNKFPQTWVTIQTH